jgi:hypothetical protein
MRSGPGRAELRELAHALLCAKTGATSVTRLCERCGSSDHGRPLALVSSGVAPSVSISYASGLVAVAWADGPVGIDVEDDGPSVDGLDRSGFSRTEARFKAGTDVPTVELAMPSGYVGWVAGTGVTWRLAGPAAPSA